LKLDIKFHFSITKKLLEEEKIHSLLQGVRNVLLASFEDMEETEHFQKT
jgi:hypothetical protein